MDVNRLAAAGWAATTPLESGLRVAYEDFVDHSLR